MTKWLKWVAAVVTGMLVTAGPAVAASSFGARLLGTEEVPVVSTAGQGFFYATLNDTRTQLDYQLYYLNLEGTITQAHIHIGQKSVSGAIVLYLCTNLTPPAGVPAPPPCPSSGPQFAAVTGSLTAANVVTQAGQGISAGEFAEVIRLIEAGVAYANVHTSTVGSGEIRGQITQ